jgi:hypothetical protein
MCLSPQDRAVLQLGPWAKAVRGLKLIVRAVSTEIIAAGLTTGANDAALCVKSDHILTIGTPLFG